MTKDAIDEIRSFVLEKLGKKYIPEEPRIYKSKVKKCSRSS